MSKVIQAGAVTANSSTGKGSNLTTVNDNMQEAASSGTSFVFIVGLIFAVINFVLSLFMKKQHNVSASTKSRGAFYI